MPNVWFYIVMELSTVLCDFKTYFAGGVDGWGLFDAV